jgi:hypothetical protein
VFNRFAKLLALVFIVPLIVTACGAKPSDNSTATAPVAGTQSTETPAVAAQVTKLPTVEGGEAGAEAALVTYSDTKQGFSIEYPGNWTQDKTITQGVKFTGGDDSLTLEFVIPPGGTDAMAYARNDVAAVTTAFPGFNQVGLAASTEVKNAIVLGFGANGTSVVTGKAYTARGDRYYMPLPDGRIAVLTVIGPANHYDREGVRDIALTFKLIK